MIDVYGFTLSYEAIAGTLILVTSIIVCLGAVGALALSVRKTEKNRD